MSGWRQVLHRTRVRWQRWRSAHAAVDVPLRAMQNYIKHQSANQAGSVAFSMLLSMFPLLLFLAAAAAYVGKPGSAAKLMQQLMQYAPPLVAQVLQPVVDEIEKSSTTLVFTNVRSQAEAWYQLLLNARPDMA